MTALKRAIPNCLTFGRILLVVPIVIAINQDLKIALLIFCLTALTDVFDGRLARKLGAVSEFGAILDPLADKIIYLGTLLALSFSLPYIFWIFFMTLPPETALMVIRFEPLKTRFKTSIPANDIGKEKMCLQSAAVVVMMLGLLLNYQLLVIEGIIIASLAIIYSWASLASHFQHNIKV